MCNSEMDYCTLMGQMHFHCDTCNSTTKFNKVGAAINEQMAMFNNRISPWIDVNDRLPEDELDCFVVVVDENSGLGRCEKATYMVEPKNYFWAYPHIITANDEVTHWMPIFTLPKLKDE